MRIRKLALTTAALATAGLASGCGQSGSEGSHAEPPPDQAAAQAPETALEEVRRIHVVLTGFEVSPTCAEDFNEALTGNDFLAASADTADATLSVDFTEYDMVEGVDAEDPEIATGVTYTAELISPGGESLFQWSGGEQSYDNEEACEDVADEIFATLENAQ